ncbi:MAG: S-methyl-5-thioribose-1-phosphate isomerase [marine benthic group bacterium]|nr:S-methyl-5-thioribose-1-phosphate isomerase [Gemmatimonadota bacterium]
MSTPPERSIWTVSDDARTVVRYIDQTRLPGELVIGALRTWEDADEAIRTMRVRGAPLIGVTGAYGICLAAQADPSDAALAVAAAQLREARPTAVNLAREVDALVAELARFPPSRRQIVAWAWSESLASSDIETNLRIGRHGTPLIEQLARSKPEGVPVNVLTHCNAGTLATVAHGTATSPIYLAHEAEVPVHVWVSETRPRLQGAALTAWELERRGVPHTVIVDGACAHLMQRGEVDVVLVGTDRTTRAGDVCNKIGTYPKALAAKAHHLPFYAAVPSRSIDWSIRDGVHEIPIEERDDTEVSEVHGAGPVADSVRIAPLGTRVRNPAFDVTPCHLVTGLITERGVCEPSEAGLTGLFPEMA